MSRCFPFPPPGYEKKARIEDLDLPKKDKHRKKRKKEKRDHKEKKKSRNKDKRDREKDRVKDKARTLNEAKLPDKIHCHNRQFLVQKDLEDKDNCGLTEKKYAGQSAGYGEGKSTYGSHLPEKSSAIEIMPEFPRRIKDGDSGFRNLMGEKLSVCLPERDDWLDRLVAKVTQNFDEGKTKDKFKESREEKYGNRGIREESKFSGMDSVEKNADNGTEGKRWKGNGRDEKSKEKQKDKEKQEGKAKDKNKKRKKKTEQIKIGNLEKSKEISYEDDVTSPDSIITSQLLRDSHKSVANMGSLMMKRKDFEANGIFDKDHISSNSAKFTSSCDLPRVNQKMLKSCQSSVPAASNWQVHSKPPHPDLEYLSQVYLVPKMEEWSDFCDQDWLYSSTASKLEKLKAHQFEMEMTTTPHVWAEAMQIDPIDICALPYVIPY